MLHPIRSSRHTTRTPNEIRWIVFSLWLLIVLYLLLIGPNPAGH